VNLLFCGGIASVELTPPRYFFFLFFIFAFFFLLSLFCGINPLRHLLFSFLFLCSLPFFLAYKIMRKVSCAKKVSWENIPIWALHTVTQRCVVRAALQITRLGCPCFFPAHNLASSKYCARQCGALALHARN
jgi:hypothetical protein